MAFLAASMFASMLYYLFFNAIIEAIALPRHLEISKELAAANRPDLYLDICRYFVESMEEGEKIRLSVMALLRVAMAFMIIGSGLMFLLGLRLLRLGGQTDLADSTPRRFSIARLVDYLIALWEGKPSLRTAFWAFFLPITLVVWMALPFWINQLKTAKELESMLYMSLGCGIALVVYLFGLSVVWRCACNTGNKWWGWLARSAVAIQVAIFALKLYGVGFAMIPLLRGLRLL